MKNKGLQIAGVLATAGLVTWAAWYFLIRDKKEETDPGDETTDPTDNADGNEGILTFGTPPSVKGKKMYAIKNNVRVVKVKDATTARVKHNNEFVGVIEGEKTLAGSQFYVFNNGMWAVGKNLVRVTF